MEKLKIEATKDTPAVEFNPENGVFRISQYSFPENSIKFYTPIVDWIANFTDNPTPTVNFIFNLEYINTSSSKQIMKLLIALDILNDKTDLCIEWHYSEDDLDMKVIGERFSSLVVSKFVLKQVSSK